MTTEPHGETGRARADDGSVAATITRPRQQRLRIVPCELKDANAFVDAVHRHHKPVTGHRWSMAVIDEDGVRRGVATLGRPVARAVCSATVLEVLRVATDGTPNACSALYGASCQQQRAHRYGYCQTYTLASEPGTSLKAAGWKPTAIVKGRSWDAPSRRRVDTHPTEDKVRWECPCSPNEAIVISDHSVVTQPSLDLAPSGSLGAP